MFDKVHILLALLCLGSNILPSESIPSMLKGHSLIYHEPPVDVLFEDTNEITEHFITQRFDNFNHQDSRTFQMRYLKNARHFKSGGPIFIMIGGEWEIGPSHISRGTMLYDMAKKHNGLLIYTEHRYYGKTQPTTNTTLDSLKYLSVDQALADLAHFVREITADKQLNATGGVIVMGGSYSATMAVWFRQKYPHLVNGAWASSAPLHAKVNYFGYTEQVGDTFLEVGGEECYQNIEKLFKMIDDLIANDDMETLKKLFSVCDFDTKNTYDVYNFANDMKNAFASVAQTQSAEGIASYCKSINLGNTSDTLYAFSQHFQRIYLSSDESCVNVTYASGIEALRNANSSLASVYRPWYYQTCSEFGWYQSTDSQKHPFGRKAPLELYISMCRDIYETDIFNDASIEKNIQHTNDLYGGFNPNVTNVYFTHGGLDPWHRMGVLKDLNEHSPCSVVPGVSHCKDFNSINYEKDSKELIHSKVTIMNLVKKWLTY